MDYIYSYMNREIITSAGKNEWMQMRIKRVNAKKVNVKKRVWVVKIIIIMPLATACPQSLAQLSLSNGEKTLL